MSQSPKVFTLESLAIATYLNNRQSITRARLNIYLMATNLYVGRYKVFI